MAILGERVDLEHPSMAMIKIMNNNNSADNVTVSQGDKDQLTFLIIKSSS